MLPEQTDAPVDRPLRILIADDHAVVREGARLLIEQVHGWDVCGLASDGPELMRAALELRPDVIVLDLHMPQFDGLEAVRDLKRQLPEVELVVFSGAGSEIVVQQLFDAGAKSFIRKADSAHLLISAIRAAAEHRPFFTPEVSEILFARFMGEGGTRPAKGVQLTAREREILRHIAQGGSNKEVAAALGISSRTAETHRAAIMRKLAASSTADIVRYAIRNGIIEA